MAEVGVQMADPPAACTSTRELLGRLLLTRTEVASILGVSENTVDNLHRTRQLSAVKVGKFNLWKPESVRRFVEKLEPET